jgi:hypothetical protein
MFFLFPISSKSVHFYGGMEETRKNQDSVCSNHDKCLLAKYQSGVLPVEQSS